jgi:pimeloyl-ACP methyl ester carboxylesterase
MERPRLLLVAQITELEWRIKPLLEEWADVAAYDAPGVGDEPAADPLDADAVVARGLVEIERRGWDRCVIAGDEFASPMAVRIAAARPEAVAGLALGHAVLNYAGDKHDSPVDAEVMAGFRQLLQTDYRSWARAFTQITQGDYDDETMERFIERVPAPVAQQLVVLASEMATGDFEPLLRELGKPMLLAEHHGCIVFRREGYREAVDAFPAAHTVSTTVKPNCSPEFAQALRTFCEATTGAGTTAAKY